jgi:hypothetical protein
MPLLIDGNNLLHRLPRARRSREQVRRLTLDLCRGHRTRVVVVFDGPPPDGTPEREELGQVSIRYAGARSADDLIIGSLPAGVGARDWTVVSDDRELRRRATDRGARARTVAEWQRTRAQPRPTTPRTEPKLSAREVAQWEAFFADRPEEE